MDGCVIGDNCIIAGHSFLKEGSIIPPNSIVMGAPGKVMRSRNNFVANRLNAYLYYRNALAYADGRYREWQQLDFAADADAELRRLQSMVDALGA